MENGTPNRHEFAKTVAEAYFAQYGEDRSRMVMNNQAIDYNMETNTFASCSSLTPTNDNEIRVDELEMGMFGDEVGNEEYLTDYIENYADEYWNVILEIIEPS